MPSDTIKVVAQTDAFLRIARARPLSAIAELIWNSLDADANNVTVYFDTTELGLRGAIVEDDGQGATPEEAMEFFRRLGGSWKKPGGRTTKHGRVLHGSHGQGRYKALSIGRSIKWTYYYGNGEEIYEFALSILGDDPSEVRYNQPKKSQRSRTGCIVEILEPIRQFKNLDNEEALLELTELFAIYLSDYPDVHVSYAGQALNPKSAITNQFLLEVPEVRLASGETATAGKLRVLEWRHLDRRSLFICDARGFALQQVTTRFQLKKHSFSAYFSPLISIGLIKKIDSTSQSSILWPPPSLRQPRIRSRPTTMPRIKGKQLG